MPKKKKRPKDRTETRKTECGSQGQARQGASSAFTKEERKISIIWPLPSVDFRLVCCLCYVKVREGIGGEIYKSEYMHSCSHDYLIIRTKNSPHLSWMRIRCRPLERIDISGAHRKLCTGYQSGECTSPTCPLPHNNTEMDLWDLEKDGVFDIQHFLNEAQERKIFSSEMAGLVLQMPDLTPKTNVQKTMFIPVGSHASFPESSTPTKHKPIVGPRSVFLRQEPCVSSYTNPLQSECRLFCSTCLHFSGTAWFYIHDASPAHKCLHNILAFVLQDESGQTIWAQVRERDGHSHFEGNYALCKSVLTGNHRHCKYKDDCHYAHSEEEKLLWTLEKKGGFNIGQFIHHNKRRESSSSSASSKQSQLYSFLQTYRGLFTFICRNCFFEKSLISKASPDKKTCLGPQRHNWETSKVLAHYKDSAYIHVDKRKFVHHGAFFPMCRHGICRELTMNRCRFAHSAVEQAVWCLQRDTGIIENELVQQSTALGHKINSQAPFERTNAEQRTFPAFRAQKRVTVNKPPVALKEVCGRCWGNRVQSEEDPRRDKCVRGHNNFRILSVFVASGKEIRKLPGHLYPTTKLVLCYNKSKCTRFTCGFPHGQEELQIWKWMLSRGIKNLRDVADRCSGVHQHAASASPGLKQTYAEIARSMENISRTSTSYSSKIHASTENICAENNIPAFYCQYCEQSCNGDLQWEEHRVGQKHINNVNCDKEHQWNFRQPPWGQGSNLDLCARHLHNKSCRYSYVPDMYNLCRHAHSQEELDEWQERHEWRQMKRAVARDRNMFSYTECLLDEYHSQENSVNVIAEKIPGVHITSKEDDVIYKTKKNDIFTWTFEIHTEKALEHIALLHNKDRLHFTLASVSGEEHQVAPGDMFLAVDDEDKACYKIDVHFTGGMFGSFSQWVVFDFGNRPVLVKKLFVEIGDQVHHEKVKDLREKLSVERWTSQNRDIVPCQNSIHLDEFTQQLLQRYKEPSTSEDVVTSHKLIELNQHNYVHKMHGLLELEEITRQSIIARYNMICDVTISQFINEEKSGFLIGKNGDLFIKVTLSENLSSDTMTGKLLLFSVQTALLARIDSTSNKVYEAKLVGEDNYKYDGRGRDYIYLVISADSAKAMPVSAGQTVQMEVQFHMDRTFFCRMHYALDSLSSMQLVFPDVVQFKPDVNLLKQMANIRSDFLNEDQLAVVRHIVVPRKGCTPPLIMYGPFGTGKTETLAQATIALLATQRNQCRILICTQSNSAADLYITKYLHAFFKKNGNFRMLRLISKVRRIDTVPAKVLEFCYFHDSNFVIPTKEEIQHCQLVLTTVENSLVLSNLGMLGDFTHIFIDEAGQTLECEILIPLSLATAKTCVVLAGDHHQIGPTVYSKEAERQNLGVSMLERLFNYYLQIKNSGISQLKNKCLQSPLNIFLRMNYRTTDEILSFISTAFYNGPDNLKACGNIPSSIGFAPLIFHAVQGKESQNPNSTSYLNTAEAQEVVIRVTELLDNWPLEWGPMDSSQVAVIATYSDQMKYIRTLLRRDKSRPHLKDVDVRSIHSLQGREFKALFITTVRTCNLLKEQHIIHCLEAGEGLVDLGFLSSAKLLNTALTRTQSFAAVVGDPVALCMIGECSQIWKTYIKKCSTIGSICPSHFTYDAIGNMAIELQQGPEGKVLEKILMQQHKSFERNLQRSKMTIPGDTNTAKSTPSTELGSDRKDLKENSEKEDKSSADVKKCCTIKTKENQQIQGKLEQPPKIKKKYHFNELSLNMATKSGDLLKHLAQECVGGNLTGEAIRLQKLSITLEKDGLATLTYSLNESGDKDTQEYSKISEDSDGLLASTVSVEDSWMKRCHVNWDSVQLQFILEAAPTSFFKCRLSVKSPNLAYAAVLTVESVQMGGRNIEIRGTFNRGHALEGDIVVVEVLKHSDNGVLQGQVKGILEQNERPDKKLYLCQADPKDIGVLKPINPAMPDMILLNSTPHKLIVRDGHIRVYKFVSVGKIKFSHYEKPTLANVDSRLFVVRYVCWQPGFALPCGIVVGIIQNDCSLLKGMKICDIEYNIQQFMSTQAEMQAESIFPTDSCVHPKLHLDRRDLRQRSCFSINDAQRQDLEFVISVTQTGTNYEVGIHVADVTVFMDKDSVLDQECEVRGATFCQLGKEPVHMLPAKAATDVCSLWPGLDRLTLSVVITVDEEGRPCGSPEVFRSVVNSKRNFSHAEVEDVLICEEPRNDYLESCITVLEQLTSVWRNQRLGNSDVCFDLEPEEKTFQHSHTMMNEVKLQFNGIVANLLLSRFHSTTPLLTQPCPNEQTLEEWKSSNACFALNSLTMSKAFLKYEVCRCQQACTCVFKYMRQHKLRNLKELAVFKHSWFMIAEALKEENKDLEFAQEVIVDSKSVPQVWLSAHRLEQIQQSQVYTCSENVPNSHDRLHYGLCVPAYTNFTSPLRCFISVVSQRMLSAYVDEMPSPYTPKEMDVICRAATETEIKVARFYHDGFMLHLCYALKAKPAVMNAVVEWVDSQTLTLNLGPGLKGISCQHVDLHLLSPGKVSVEHDGHVRLDWQERVFEHSVQESQKQNDSETKLDSDQLVFNIPTVKWQRLLQTVRENNVSGLMLCAQEISLHVENEIAMASKSEPEVLSSLTHHFVPFSLAVREGQGLRVQVCARLCRGRLSPCIQLVHLTQRLAVCLEHKRGPEECFTTQNDKSSRAQHTYSDEREYLSSWLLPSFALETAHQAVDKGERITIHGVSIAWSKEKIIGILGEFILSREFCERSSFHPNTTSTMLDGSSTYHEDDNFCLGYLCVRYCGLSVAEVSDLHESVAAVVENAEPTTWVCHCLVKEIRESATGFLIKIALVQSSVKIPEQLLEKDGTSLLCTLEWICKTQEHRVIEAAARNLSSASDFVKDIITGRKPTNTVEPIPIGQYSKILHPEQDTVISECYRQPFAAVLGGFGTGKSTVAACLTHLLVGRNQITSTARDDFSSHQLMICGPTEESLDVLTGYLQRLNSITGKIIRVYSEEVEEHDFPTLSSRKSSTQPKCSVRKDMALHYLARTKQTSHGKRLSELQTAGTNGRHPEFKNQLEKAYTYYLKKAEVIVCTCITSARPILRSATNVRQIIMDDAGLIPEMEAIVPLVMHKNVNQLLIFGDIKMPWKKMDSTYASNLGLSRSLLHRYGVKAKKLNSQSRTTKPLARIPSTCFHKGKLQTAANVRVQAPAQTIPWPGRENLACVFCHVQGEEAKVSASDGDGCSSRAWCPTYDCLVNQKEIQIVCEIVDAMIRRHGIKETAIMVITATEAQSFQIRNSISHSVVVCTVLESVGRESNYVILSTVRSLPPSEVEPAIGHRWAEQQLGNMAEEGTIYLATTRARTAFFIVGNEDLLSSCPTWQAFLALCRESGCLVRDTAQFLQSLIPC